MAAQMTKEIEIKAETKKLKRELTLLPLIRFDLFHRLRRRIRC